MNVVIACGGTGGHLFPGLAVGEVLRGRGHRVLLLVSEKDIDRKALEGRGGFDVRQLPSMGWPRGLSLQTLRFLKQLFAARLFCRKLYCEFRPDALLAMGGFTSAAPVWEARRLGVPSVIHEANAIPGRANRLLARAADRVVIGFAEAGVYFDAAKAIVGGTPVRAELRLRQDPAAIRAEWGFDPRDPLVLVMGGSQGARGVNTRIIEALPHLKDTGCQWALLTGVEDEERVRAAFRDSGQKNRVWPFCHEMQKLYAIADLVISRSGASSITETNYFGLPAIYIPYPFAADRHQSANAKIQVSAGAALCLEEDSLTGARLAEAIRDLISRPEERKLMGLKSRSLSTDDAAERLADLLCGLAGKEN